MLTKLLVELILLFVFSFISLFFFRKLAKKIGLVDKPNARKTHQDDVPLVGGLSICFSLLYFVFYNPHLIPHAYIYMLSITILVAVGVLDDRFDISFKLRMFIQAGLSIVMMTLAGLKLHMLGNLFTYGAIELGLFSYLLTIIAVIGSINAFNMVDGIDGLLGGLSIVTFSGLAILFGLEGQFNSSYLCLAIVVIMLPYILMNLGLLGRKRKVFMGDAGSMLIGFTVIWLVLSVTQVKGAIIMRPITAVWLIAIPLMDMAAIMYRRIRRGNSPFKPDREHLHHIFQRLGFSSNQTLLVICFMATLCAAFGILGEMYQIPEIIMLISFLGLFAVYAYTLSHIWVLSAKFRQSKLIK